MKTFTGIADCHGIESFKEYPKGRVPTVFSLRAATNRQRHALVYQVDLDDEQEKLVNKMIEKKQWQEALVYLKSLPTFGVEQSMQRSITMIPNDDLDPYWNQ